MGVAGRGDARGSARRVAAGVCVCVCVAHTHTHTRTHARTHTHTIFVRTAAAAPKMAFSCTILRWRLWRLVSAERRVVVCDGGNEVAARQGAE